MDNRRYNRGMPGTSISMSILERLLKSREDLSPEVARYFLDLSFSQADLDRMTVLSEKANEGELSRAETEELQLYVLLSDFLTIMQSRARVSLRAKSPAA